MKTFSTINKLLLLVCSFTAVAKAEDCTKYVDELSTFCRYDKNTGVNQLRKIKFLTDKKTLKKGCDIFKDIPNTEIEECDEEEEENKNIKMIDFFPEQSDDYNIFNIKSVSKDGSDCPDCVKWVLNKDTIDIFPEDAENAQPFTSYLEMEIQTFENLEKKSYLLVNFAYSNEKENNGLRILVNGSPKLDLTKTVVSSTKTIGYKLKLKPNKSYLVQLEYTYQGVDTNLFKRQVAIGDDDAGDTPSANSFAQIKLLYLKRADFLKYTGTVKGEPDNDDDDDDDEQPSGKVNEGGDDGTTNNDNKTDVDDVANGDDNTGDDNTGDYNTGDDNTGDDNNADDGGNYVDDDNNIDDTIGADQPNEDGSNGDSNNDTNGDGNNDTNGDDNNDVNDDPMDYPDQDIDDGTTNDGTNDGTTNDGTINDGTANDGTTNDGTTNDGTTNDGTTNDGTTNDDTNNDDTNNDGTTNDDNNGIDQNNGTNNDEDQIVETNEQGGSGMGGKVAIIGGIGLIASIFYCRSSASSKAKHQYGLTQDNLELDDLEKGIIDIEKELDDDDMNHGISNRNQSRELTADEEAFFEEMSDDDEGYEAYGFTKF